MLLTLDDKAAETKRRLPLSNRFADPSIQRLAKKHFALDPASWIDDWTVSYNPKDLGMAHQPFRLSDKQRQLITWMQAIVERREEGLLEKSRDVGVSWILALFALNRFLFVPGFKTTYGSYQADKVDKRGDPDSWFEKIRMALEYLPKWQMPTGWDPRQCDNWMRMVNPENGNTIVGDVGRQLGRGGRSTLVLIDEAAFFEDAQEVARSVASNADAKVWASTVNGMANTFYIKREAIRGRDPSLIFRLHWRDDPRKDDAWAERQRSEMLPEDWASEFNIDYGASVEGQLIKAEWVEASRKLAVLHERDAITGDIRSGLDVGAGKAESVLATVRGPAVIDLTAWRDPDSVDTASQALDRARELGSSVVHYDATMVGFSQGAIMRRMGEGISIVGVNVGEPPPDYIRIVEGDKMVPASDRFANLKALGWWQLRERAQASWQKLYGKRDPPLSDCLLLVGQDPTLDAQLCQATSSKNLRGKRQINKAPSGARSPDRADAVCLAMMPVRTGGKLQRARLIGI